jgi:hypothetical protein
LAAWSQHSTSSLRCSGRPWPRFKAWVVKEPRSQRRGGVADGQSGVRQVVVEARDLRGWRWKLGFSWLPPHSSFDGVQGARMPTCKASWVGRRQRVGSSMREVCAPSVLRRPCPVVLWLWLARAAFRCRQDGCLEAGAPGLVAAVGCGAEVVVEEANHLQEVGAVGVLRWLLVVLQRLSPLVAEAISLACRTGVPHPMDRPSMARLCLQANHR